MNKMAVISVALLGIFASPLSHSADFNDCQVVEVVAAGANNAHIQLSCWIEPRPACASSGNYFGFDKSTEEGKQYLSMVLTAFASGAKLTGWVDDAQCPTFQPNVTLLQHLRMTK